MTTRPKRPRHAAASARTALAPAQAVIHLTYQPAPRGAGHVRVLAHRGVGLRGQDDALPSPEGQGLTHDLLRLAVGIHVRRVEEVDAGVQGSMNDPDRLVMVRITPGAEHHRPEAVRAHLDTGPTERAPPHRRHAATLRAMAVATPTENRRRQQIHVTDRVHARDHPGDQRQPGARPAAGGKPTRRDDPRSPTLLKSPRARAQSSATRTTSLPTFAPSNSMLIAAAADRCRRRCRRRRPRRPGARAGSRRFRRAGRGARRASSRARHAHRSRTSRRGRAERCAAASGSVAPTTRGGGALVGPLVACIGPLGHV